jgi:ubiquinol-cytochrome c reductase cytochrome b subunit
MPLLGRWKLGHRFNLGVAFAMIAGIGLLTWQAYAQDGSDPEFVQAKELAEEKAERIVTLARAPDGIPGGGALALLRDDPLVQGPRLFADNCASCHTYDGHDGLGSDPSEPPSASDLHRFGSREWITGLLDPERIATAEYLGGTDFSRGRMVRYVQRGIAQFDHEEQVQLSLVVSALSAEAELPYQVAADSAEHARIQEGLELIQSEAMRCTECHEFRGMVEEARGPSLTGFASRAWTHAFVSNPAHPSLYGDRNDRMPAFGEDGILTEHQIGLIVDWLREDWYRPGTTEPALPAH